MKRTDYIMSEMNMRKRLISELINGNMLKS